MSSENQQQAKIPVEQLLLRYAEDTKCDCQVYLSNGIKLTGRIEAFDERCILMDNGKTIMLIYKNAISSVIPVGVSLSAFGSAIEKYLT